MRPLTKVQKATIKNWSKDKPKGYWRIDFVKKHNQQVELAYIRRNDFDGHYIELYQTGHLTLGTFTCAYPYITDGIFLPVIELDLSPDEAMELRKNLFKKGGK